MGPGKFIEKRRGPDIWTRLILAAGILCLFGFFVGMVFLQYAKPEYGTILDRWYKRAVRTYWDQGYLLLGFFTALTVFYLSTMGLLINTRRHKRRGDRYNPWLIFVWGLSLASIILYAVFR